MPRRLLALVAVVVLTLSACTRTTEVVIELDLLSFTTAELATTAPLLPFVARTPLYFPLQDGVADIPSGGMLVELDGTIANLGGVLRRFELTIGVEVDATVALDAFTIRVHVGDPETYAADVFVPDTVWAELSLTGHAANVPSTGRFVLAVEPGDELTDLVFSGNFRLGVFFDVASGDAGLDDTITLRWTEAMVSLTAVPGVLLPGGDER